MTYAIIGAGAIGTAIAGHFSREGISAKIANRSGPESLSGWIEKSGGHVQPATLGDALKADVVFLAVPFTVVREVLAQGGDWTGRLLIDATNAIDFPGFTPTDLGGRASTHLVADAAPGAEVVKAFNTLPAAILAADPEGPHGRRVLFLSSDARSAAAKATHIVESLGFAAIDLGSIAEGGLLQQFGGPLMVHNLIKEA